MNSVDSYYDSSLELRRKDERNRFWDSDQSGNSQASKAT